LLEQLVQKFLTVSEFRPVRRFLTGRNRFDGREVQPPGDLAVLHLEISPLQLVILAQQFGL
jgi:hypothetical protein